MERTRFLQAFSKKKRTIFFSVLFILILLIFSVHVFNNHHTNSGKKIIENDTITARQQMNIGNTLQYSKPDSAIFYVNNAIDRLKPYDKDEKIKLMLASCYIRLASVNNYSGNYPESQKYDSLAINIGLTLGNKDMIAQALNIKGLLSFNQSEYPSALEYYKKAAALAGEAQNKKLEAKINANTAIIYYYQGNYDKAYEYFSKTMTTAQEINDSLLFSGSLINLGLVAQNAGNTESAICNYEKAKEICSRIGDENGVVLCYQNLGGLWLNKGNFTRALDAMNQSLQIAIKMADRSNIAKAYHNLGEIYANLGDYQTAIANYIRSAGIKEELKDEQGMAVCYTSIGSLNYQRGDCKLALEYYRKALDINQKLNYQQGIAKNYSNFANIYRQTGKWDKGLQSAFRALTMYRQLHYDEGMTELYSIIGSLYAGKEDYPKAEEYLKMALERSKAAGNQEEMATSMNELAALNLRMAENSPLNQKTNLYATAVTYGSHALILSKEDNVLPLQLEAALVLKEAYLKMNDFQKALMFSEESRSISDSLTSQSKEKALTLAEAKWNAERNLRKIDRLEQDQVIKDNIIKQKEEESKLKNAVIYLLVAVVCLSLIMAYMIVIYVRKKKDRQYEKQLANMTMLRMQNARNRMSPHFFFNVLNTVSGSAGDPQAFKNNMKNLSLLLRKSIENIEQTAIPLGEEIRIVNAFIELQSQRIPGGIELRFDVPESVNEKQLIPAMIIQIPVENAIKHGLMPLPGTKKLSISVRETSNSLIITIKDNGIGMAASVGRSTGTGTGLKVLLQTITLLNARNKDRIEFSINGNNGGKTFNEGTIVSISVPLDFDFTSPRDSVASYTKNIPFVKETDTFMKN